MRASQHKWGVKKRVLVRATAAGIDVGHQAHEGRTLQCAAGDTAIIVSTGKALPPFAVLANQKGGACFMLCIQRVELMLKALPGRFAGVNCAPHTALL